MIMETGDGQRCLNCGYRWWRGEFRGDPKGSQYHEQSDPQMDDLVQTGYAVRRGIKSC